MLLLNSKTQNILILTPAKDVINQNYYSYTPIRHITNLVTWNKVDEYPSYFTRYRSYSSENCSGVWFGTEKEMLDEIKKKLNTSSISGYKTLYFTKASNFPRYKLANDPNLKRCIKIDKADAVIIPKTYNYAQPTSNNNGLGYSSEKACVYSASSDCYYIIPGTIHENICSGKQYYNARDYIKTLPINPNTIDRTIDVLKHFKLLPPDVQVMYKGSVVYLDDNSYDLYNIIINKNMKLIYDTDLDIFVSQNGNTLTQSDIDTLDGMLSSTDPSVVAMGMKLLSGFNITPFACAVTTLLYKNLATINTNSSKNSVGFRQVLSTLNLNLRSSRSSAINNAYANSTSDEDKAFGKSLVLAEIKDALNSVIQTYKQTYSNIEFDSEITLT